jgi:hypothetical protein
MIWRKFNLSHHLSSLRNQLGPLSSRGSAFLATPASGRNNSKNLISSERFGLLQHTRTDRVRSGWLGRRCLSPQLQKKWTKASVRVPRMFNSHVRPTVMVKQLNVTITVLLEYISFKMTPGSKNDYKASINTSFILSVAWMGSTGANRGRGLPTSLPLARTGHHDSIPLLDHLWQWKARLSRLLIPTQQVGEKMTWGLFHNEGLTWVWLAESGGYNLYQKLLWLIPSYKLFSLKCDIEPTTECIVIVQPKRTTDQPTQHPNHTNTGYSNHARIHAAHNCEHDYHDSSTLCKGCTHSPWVMIILGSQASIDPTEYLYTLLVCALGYHYMAFQWLLLICSAHAEVSPKLSVHNHQGPPLAPCGSQESLLLYPLIPNQADP